MRARLTDVEHGLLKNRSASELIDALAKGEAQPDSGVGRAQQMAILALLIERAATPRRWALVAVGAAVLSGLGTFASAIILAVE